MTAQELFAQNPLYAQRYDEFRAGGGASTPEEWLAGFQDQGSLLQLGYDSQQNLAASKAQQRAITESGNTNSIQQGQQQGQFNSQGQTQQSGTQTQNQTGTQTSQESQTGTQTGQQTSQTGVTDTLGFGDLLKSQAGAAQASDTATRGFLTDLIQTGGQGFQGQVDQAARRSLSGPGMLGTGVGAQGRVAGAAVGDVARNNLGQRLQAAQQLTGPTAVTNLVQAGNPFLGQTQTGTNSSTGTQTSNGTQNTTQQSVGIQDLLTNESQSGTSKANTIQSALGNQPTQSGGGCYVSSVLGLRGLVPLRVIRSAVRYKLSQRRYRYMLWGYSFYGSRLASWIERHHWTHRGMSGLCRAILYQELRWSGRKLQWKLWPALTHAVFHYGSALTALVFNRKSVTPAVPDIAEKLEANNLMFKETYK